MSETNNMPEKEKMNSEETAKVSGGNMPGHQYRSGPYTCPYCKEEYYIGDEEMDMGMCQSCFHGHERLTRSMHPRG